MLAAWIESGQLIDVILLLVLAEAFALAAWRWRARRPPLVSQLLANLAAGAMLLLALRAALTDAGWLWIAIWLSLALLAHGADIALRFRRNKNPG